MFSRCAAAAAALTLLVAAPLAAPASGSTPAGSAGSTGSAAVTHTARATGHFTVVAHFHGVKVLGCRFYLGNTNTAYRLDTRNAHKRARAKVASIEQSQLVSTSFSNHYPRFQRVGKVRPFSGFAYHTHPKQVTEHPTITLKGGAKHHGASYTVASLPKCPAGVGSYRVPVPTR